MAEEMKKEPPFPWMVRMVERGEAVDVSNCPREGGHYTLEGPPREGMEYCAVDHGFRIRSIGRRKSDGTIVASVAPDLYENPEYECVWLH